jgi:O-antigen/teichoic acid export membrane protein
MSVTVLLAPFLYVASALLVGSGRPQFASISTVVHLLMLVVLVPVFANRWGIVGAAYADMIATLALTIVLLVTAQLATGQMNRSTITAAVVLPVAASFSAGALAWIVDAYVTPASVRLIVELCVIGSGYPLLILLLGGKTRLFDLTALLRGVFRMQVVATE